MLGDSSIGSERRDTGDRSVKNGLMNVRKVTSNHGLLQTERCESMSRTIRTEYTENRANELASAPGDFSAVADVASKVDEKVT